MASLRLPFIRIVTHSLPPAGVNQLATLRQPVRQWRSQLSRAQRYATEATARKTSSEGSSAAGRSSTPSSSSPSSSSPSSSSSSSTSSSTSAGSQSTTSDSSATSTQSSQTTSSPKVDPADQEATSSLPPGWEDERGRNISQFSELPHREFGFNQHMVINAEFKEALRQVLWQFRAPIRYAFAYGSGVFTQSDVSPSQATRPSPHPNAPEAVTKWQASGSGAKTIDFIFGVSFTQHWHSLNLQQHRDHYSFLGSFGSGIVSKVQDGFGAGAYFNPYVTVNGIMIKYGVFNLDTIYEDLYSWENLYIAGRLQKPVKILRDDARIRLANQVNLISALRTALLMLPEEFSERDLYRKIAGLSYMGDPRMYFGAEHPYKVANIVDHQMTNFRQLYLPLIEDLPNVAFDDATTSTQGWTGQSDVNCTLKQDMDPHKRGNMVRRLPRSFRTKLYDSYQRVFKIPLSEYDELIRESKDETTFSKSEGGDFDRRIAGQAELDKSVAKVIRRTVTWPAAVESGKGLLTAGMSKSWRYFWAKRAKGKEQKKESKGSSSSTQSKKEAAAESDGEKESSAGEKSTDDKKKN